MLGRYIHCFEHLMFVQLDKYHMCSFLSQDMWYMCYRLVQQPNSKFLISLLQYHLDMVYKHNSWIDLL